MVGRGALASVRALSVAPECGEVAFPERDGCLVKRVSTLNDPAEVAREARSIVDPVLKLSAVMSWANAHRGEVTDREASMVCGVLPVGDATPCARHLMCAHLR
jgi:hypothetical protein